MRSSKAHQPPLRWPRRVAPSLPPSLAVHNHAYVLDLDPDLAEVLDERSREAAGSAAIAATVAAATGACDLAACFAALGGGPGLLLLDGIVAFQTEVAGRTALELIGEGDLVQVPPSPREDLLARTVTWHVLTHTTFALLDREFSDRVRPWPALLEELLRRAGRRAGDIDTLRAITGHPRLEVRLILLLWHLAARWGRVEPAGVRLVLPLTHRLLGQLVAAERPSISHALSRLAAAGLLSGTTGDLHLSGTPEQHLEALEHQLLPAASYRRGPAGPARARTPVSSRAADEPLTRALR